jgi:AraC family transcriptional regulator
MYSIKKIRLTPADMQTVELAIIYVDRNYRSKISAEQLSTEFSLPKEKLQAGFQKRTGLTVHQYMLQTRIEKVKDLLTKTNAPLKLIAYWTGFTHEAHLCNVFKRIAATSPIEFRLQNVG